MRRATTAFRPTRLFRRRRLQGRQRSTGRAAQEDVHSDGSLPDPISFAMTLCHGRRTAACNRQRSSSIWPQSRSPREGRSGQADAASLSRLRNVRVFTQAHEDQRIRTRRRLAAAGCVAVARSTQPPMPVGTVEQCGRSAEHSPHHHAGSAWISSQSIRLIRSLRKPLQHQVSAVHQVQLLPWPGSGPLESGSMRLSAGDAVTIRAARPFSDPRDACSCRRRGP